jgi:cytochrome c oxidase subunit 3
VARLSLVAEQFDDLEQQRQAAAFGMWIFIVTEVMLFGGMFLAYTAYRWIYHAAWIEGSHHMALVIGSVNTAVLIVSSLMMAMAVHEAQRGRRRRLVLFLALTIALGLVFLVLKGVEYASHAGEHLVPGRLWRFAGPDSHAVEIFFWLYYAMTGLHALHLTVGVGVVSVMLVLAWRGRFTPSYHNPVEVTGLYWHLIDVIWIFLYPLFYLVV